MNLPVVNCVRWDSGDCLDGLFGGRPSAGVCAVACAVRRPRDDGPAVTYVDAPDPATPAPVPRADWPAWAAWLADRRIDQDRGVGDTLERLLGAGGVAFKATWAATFGRLGIDCGCAARRARWNRTYPYMPT